MKKPFHLLMVEDGPEMRGWLCQLIASRWPDGRITAVETAIDFHRAMDRERPSLLLLDEVLGPGEDLASLLQIARREGLPVVLMTSTAMTSAFQNVPEGVLARLSKPIWSSGAGTQEFLAELGKVMALTAPG